MTVDRAALVAALTEVRDRAYTLLDPVSREDQMRQISPIMSPLVWDLAHMANYEELWLVHALGGGPRTSAAYDDMYNAFEHPRRERPRLPLLDPEQSRAYYDAVRSRTLAVLERLDPEAEDPLVRDGFVHAMVVMHHHQHVETLLAAMRLGGVLTEVPAEPAPAQPPDADEVHVPAGEFVMGTDDHAWAYDNEKPAHRLHVEGFWIDSAPVTNAAFAAFVADGGYRREELWHPAGWAHARASGLGGPGGGDHGAEPAAPVVHVSWYEADAYARWLGRRLPTEAEWEKAASWTRDGRKLRWPWGDEPQAHTAAACADRANLTSGATEPSRVGSYPEGTSPWGCHQMIGDVWEWTSSDFVAYPGFRPYPYKEYSEVFFGSEHKVLRGGSWATHPSCVRTTFRNWDFPVRRQIFAGFRTARDAR